MPTIFLAGVYGVGKSTLAEKLSSASGIPCFSAGDLISKVNGEKYGSNKVVVDKNKNQDILAACVSEILQKSEAIILAGHFCIVNREGKVKKIPDAVFAKLQIEKIILLEAAPQIIRKHLSGRDGKDYSLQVIESLLSQERQCSESTAEKLHCPLVIHQMRYTDEDAKLLENEL